MSISIKAYWSVLIWLLLGSFRLLVCWIIKPATSLLFIWGFPIGGDSRKLNFWQPLLNHIKSRLSSRKSRNLSLGGRLVILKFVLPCLPVYFLSFFKAPACIVSFIESIFNCFLLGGRREDVMKISWINWDIVCSNKENKGYWRLRG